MGALTLLTKLVYPWLVFIRRLFLSFTPKEDTPINLVMEKESWVKTRFYQQASEAHSQTFEWSWRSRGITHVAVGLWLAAVALHDVLKGALLLCDLGGRGQ